MSAKNKPAGTNHNAALRMISAQPQINSVQYQQIYSGAAHAHTQRKFDLTKTHFVEAFAINAFDFFSNFTINGHGYCIPGTNKTKNSGDFVSGKSNRHHETNLNANINIFR